MSTQNRNFLWVIHDYFYDGVTTSNCHCVEKGRQCSCNRGDYIVSGPQWPLPWSKFDSSTYWIGWPQKSNQSLCIFIQYFLSCSSCMLCSFAQLPHCQVEVKIESDALAGSRPHMWRDAETKQHGKIDWNTTWTVLCARFFEVSHVTPKVVHHFGCDTTLAGFLGVTGWNQMQRSCCSRNFLVIVFGGEGCL